jgi:C1A family cysteine protease
VGAFRDSFGGTPLAQTGLVDEHHQRKLEALSITTVEELLSVARAAPGAIGQFMEGTNLPQLQADAGLLAGPALMAVQAFESEFEGAWFALGAEAPDDVPVEEVAQTSTFEEMVTALAQSEPPTGQRVDLLDSFGPIRDQARRGTCVGHAGAAVLECLHRRETGNLLNTSPQFLFHSAKMADGHPEKDGTWSRFAMPSLADAGNCEEDFWPYEPLVIPGNVHHGPPPAEAVENATQHRVVNIEQLAPRDSAAIRVVVDDGRPVTISVPVYQNWWGAVTKSTGKIPMPLPQTLLDGGHALCVAGYDFDDDFTGGGYFIVRNSWGVGWAPQSPIAPGYGALPFEYIDRYGWEAYTARLQ